MAIATQAECLPPVVKPLLPDAFKGERDGKTIINFTYQSKLYFILVSISNKYVWVLFTDRLLWGPAYTWFITWQYETEMHPLG